MTPFEGATPANPGYFCSEGETKRQALNEFIRTSGEFDGVIDFDLATRDPENPSVYLPAYDSGDHLHPNDAGYEAMANAIDLSLFTPCDIPSRSKRQQVADWIPDPARACSH